MSEFAYHFLFGVISVILWLIYGFKNNGSLYYLVRKFQIHKEKVILNLGKVVKSGPLGIGR